MAVVCMWSVVVMLYLVRSVSINYDRCEMRLMCTLQCTMSIFVCRRRIFFFRAGFLLNFEGAKIAQRTT